MPSLRSEASRALQRSWWRGSSSQIFASETIEGTDHSGSFRARVAERSSQSAWLSSARRASGEVSTLRRSSPWISSAPWEQPWMRRPVLRVNLEMK